MNPAREQAWRIRREKYGPQGHGKGAYQTRTGRSLARVEKARDEISAARRQLQMLLPEPAAHKAITALDLADLYLAGERDNPNAIALINLANPPPKSA